MAASSIADVLLDFVKEIFMKVGILTFPNSTSYGATLQMYALYKKVNDLGHDAEIINYFNAFMKAEKHMRKVDKLDLRRTLRHWAKRALHYRLEKAFRDFEKSNMVLYPKKAVTDKAALPDIGNRYGAVICGSDQVWNPNITDTDLSFFLDFCGKGVRRISYAPSFGIDDFSREFSDLIRPEIAAFDSLSVREAVGREYIKSEFGRDAQLVCDPTMLLSAEEWSTVEREYPIGSEGYILFYTIKKSEKLMDYCRTLSEKTGLKIITVGGNILKKIKSENKKIEYAVDISPEQWLYLVHNATCIVTNSFHGTAFSILYRKNFYVELSSATNSRLSHITDIFGLKSRIVNCNAVSEIENCNFDTADIELSKIRIEATNFLKDALLEEEK